MANEKKLEDEDPLIVFTEKDPNLALANTTLPPLHYNKLLLAFRFLMGCVRGSYIGFSVLGLLFGVFLPMLTGGLSIWLPLACAIPLGLWVAQFTFRDERQAQKRLWDHREKTIKDQTHLANLRQNAKNIPSLEDFLRTKQAKEKYQDIETYADYLQIKHQDTKSLQPKPKPKPTNTAPKSLLRRGWERLERWMNVGFEFIGGAKDATRVEVGVGGVFGLINSALLAKTGMVAFGTAIFIGFAIPIAIYALSCVGQFFLIRNRAQKIDQLKLERKPIKDETRYLENQLAKKPKEAKKLNNPYYAILDTRAQNAYVIEPGEKSFQADCDINSTDVWPLDNKNSTTNTFETYFKNQAPENLDNLWVLAPLKEFYGAKNYHPSPVAHSSNDNFSPSLQAQGYMPWKGNIYMSHM